MRITEEEAQTLQEASQVLLELADRDPLWVMTALGNDGRQHEASLFLLHAWLDHLATRTARGE